MAIKVDEVSNPGLTTEKEVTNVSKKKKAATAGERDFNMAVAIVGVAWVILFLLVWSLREYNI